MNFSWKESKHLLILKTIILFLVKKLNIFFKLNQQILCISKPFEPGYRDIIRNIPASGFLLPYMLFFVFDWKKFSDHFLGGFFSKQFSDVHWGLELINYLSSAWVLVICRWKRRDQPAGIRRMQPQTGKCQRSRMESSKKTFLWSLITKILFYFWISARIEFRLRILIVG